MGRLVGARRSDGSNRVEGDYRPCRGKLRAPHLLPSDLGGGAEARSGAGAAYKRGRTDKSAPHLDARARGTGASWADREREYARLLAERA
jgi:hypothetical protein